MTSRTECRRDLASLREVLPDRGFLLQVRHADSDCSHRESTGSLKCGRLAMQLHEKSKLCRHKYI